MLLRFSQSNFQWTSASAFTAEDKHLRDMNSQRFRHDFNWERKIPLEPAIHLLCGPRQIGKTTGLKMFMAEMMNSNRVAPSNLFFLPCDTITDTEELIQILQSFLASLASSTFSVILLDEVTFIKNWERAIKFLVDTGALQATMVIITGSDSVLLEDGAKSFPGIHRRGKHGQDISVFPLTFHDYLKLVAADLTGTNSPTPGWQQTALTYFNQYLRCGGYLSAINNLERDGSIPDEIHRVYEQWVIGDFVRKGKDRRKLYDILRILLERQLSPLSYTTIAKESAQLSVDTVADYLHHLEHLGVIHCLHAIDLSTKSAYPKKDKKFHFADPFIAVTLFKMLHREGLISKRFYPCDPALVEAVVAAHYIQSTSCFYLKTRAGEIDLVVLADGTPRFIEVKWKDTTDKQDLKTISKHQPGWLLTKSTVPLSENPKIQSIPEHLAMNSLAALLD
jgi:uncharacterized protein